MSNMNQTAFPVIDPSNEVSDPGLTKLEYAAIQIAAGIWSNSGIVDNGHDISIEYVSVLASASARSLFAELEKRK